jgi:hypothetical protein
MENTLFENFVLWLVRNKMTFTITTGLAYGHKIYKQGEYQFTEINESKVNVTSDNFCYDATTLDELIKISRSIKEKNNE